MRKWLVCVLSFCFFSSAAQTAREIEKIITTTRNVITLPEDYNTLFADDGKQAEFDAHFTKLMPESIMKRNIKTLINGKPSILQCEQCALPYVQLDTSTKIRYKRNLYGYWRAVTIRIVRYTDSINNENKLYRTAVLEKENKDADIIASISETTFRMYYRGTERDKLKILTDSKYSLEEKRYLLLYHNLKSAADVSFIGIDKEGRLILNSYSAEKRYEQDKYVIYETTVQQTVFEKLNVQQLHYDKEKKERVGTDRHIGPY